MQYFFLAIILVLAQALVFSRIHVFGVATPFVYVYFAMFFQRNASRWLQLVSCFLVGLIVDMFCNTPGLSAASLTLVGFVQPYLLEAFLSKEDSDKYVPSIKNMGLMRYFSYALILTLLFCIVMFSLEAFSFSHFAEWILCVSSSFVLTLLLVLIIDAIRR